jgi:hypothetical protein
MSWGFGFGCCCCVIAEDAFATDDLATSWGIRTGTPTISGGLLNFSAGTNLLVHNTAAGASTDAIYLSADFACSNTADVGRLIIAYTDDDNYWFLEGQPGVTNGSLKIFERVAGVNTQRGATATVAGFTTTNDATFQICYADGRIYANARSALGVRAATSYNATITVASTQAGLGGSETGVVTFNNFSFQQHQFEQPTCPACTNGGCIFCLSNLAPPRLQVSISGMIDATCGDCDTWNGTFICDNVGFGPLVCDWYYTGGTLCGTASLLVRLSFNSGFGVYQMFVSVDGPSGSFFFQSNSATQFDCMNWSAFALGGGGEVLNPCDFSLGASCTVTALDP